MQLQKFCWLPFLSARAIQVTLRMLEEAIVQCAVKQYGFVALLQLRADWCDWWSLTTLLLQLKGASAEQQLQLVAHWSAEADGVARSILRLLLLKRVLSKCKSISEYFWPYPALIWCRLVPIKTIVETYQYAGLQRLCRVTRK